MKILITNDDGIGSEGIAIMKDIARSFSSDVWVVAPAYDVSGCSRSISGPWPVSVEKESPREFRVKGSTSICTVLALQSGILPSMPDLVLSGVNAGSNVGNDVGYSGTLGGAFEANAFGIKAVAFSQHYTKGNTFIDWRSVKNYGEKVLKRILEDVQFDGCVMNVNFPCYDSFAGIKVVEQGSYSNQIEVDNVKMNETHEHKFFYALKKSRVFEGNGSVEAIKEGFITITPLHSDLTCRKVIKSIDSKFDDLV